MKTLKHNLLQKALLTLGAVAALATTDTAQAASIKFEARVPGYGGWVLVVPGSNLGGAVRWDHSRGCLITDRVSRGEEIRTTLSPTTGGERCNNGAVSGIYAQNGVFYFRPVTLPYSQTNRVSTDPSFDNVFVWVGTNSGYFQQRIPIGRR
jgi:hypothetical protein